MPTPPLASGPQGPGALRPLLDTVLDAPRTGAEARGGPFPTGGPETVTAQMRETLGDPLPAHGDPEALRRLVHALAAGSADPADPLCAAHLHTPPLAVATAADLAASVLNPSLDSWDQAPRRTAAASSSATAAAPCRRASTAPTRSPSTCTNSVGNRSRRGFWSYATPQISPHSVSAPTTSTPTTTPKPGSPTSSDAPCGRPAARTSSRSPSLSRPSAARDSARSSTKSASAPRSSPRSSTPTPASSSTTAPPSAPCSSGPPRHPTAPWPPYGENSSTTAGPVIGRATADGRLWLKATLLNPHTRPGDLAALLRLVELAEPAVVAEPAALPEESTPT